MRRTITRLAHVAVIAMTSAALVMATPTVAATVHGLTPTPVAGHAMAATLAPCSTEDGSTPGQAFPCVWDAATHGNGHGLSYVLTSVL